MTALYIIAGIIVFFVIIAFLKISFRISWCGDLLITVKVGFYKAEYLLFGEKTEPEEEAPVKKAVKEKAGEPVKFNQILPIIKETLSELYDKTKKHLRLERYIVKLTIASDDPAKTGILYGAASGAAASLLRFAEGVKHKTKKPGRIYTEAIPDFIGDKTDIYIDIMLSTRVWRGLSMALSLADGYYKYKKLKIGKCKT